MCQRGCQRAQPGPAGAAGARGRSQGPAGAAEDPLAQLEPRGRSRGRTKRTGRQRGCRTPATAGVRRMVEAAGIEPASRDAPSWASTRVVRRLMSPTSLRRTGSPLASSTVSRRGWAEQPPRDQPAVLRLSPPQARRPQRRCLVLRQRGSSACWHLVCSGRIYEVPGPRRATAGRVGIRSKPIAPVSCDAYRRWLPRAQGSRAIHDRNRAAPIAPRGRRARRQDAPGVTAPGSCWRSRSRARRRGCSARSAGCSLRRSQRPARTG